MALEHPFLVNIYYGGNIEYENGLVKCDKSTMHFTIVARHKIPYKEFLDIVYKHVGVEKQKCKLKITLHFEHCGKPMSSPIMSDQTLDLMYFSAEKDKDFWAQIHVEMEEILLEKVSAPSNIGPIEKWTPHTQSSEDRSESLKGFGEQSNTLNAESDSLKDVREDFNDLSEDHVPLDVSSVPSNTEGVITSVNNIAEINDDNITDSEGRLCIDSWKEEENKIRLGMRFESKSQLKNAIALWSVAQNKEFKVVESRLNTWAAKCKIAEEEKEKGKDCALQCRWYIRGLYKKNHKKWQITKWVSVHRCPKACSNNKNSNLTSTLIASHILHSIKVDPDYSVKKVQADLKKQSNVEISYKKAWHGKRKAKDGH